MPCCPSIQLTSRTNPPTQGLNVANNDLEFIPADIGWLPLRELHVSGNPRLRMPPVVLKQGFKWVLRWGGQGWGCTGEGRAGAVLGRAGLGL